MRKNANKKTLDSHVQRRHPLVPLSKQDLKLNFFIQAGYEAVSVDRWDYREGFEMITIVQECLDGISGRNGICYILF